MHRRGPRARLKDRSGKHTRFDACEQNSGTGGVHKASLTHADAIPPSTTLSSAPFGERV